MDMDVDNFDRTLSYGQKIIETEKHKMDCEIWENFIGLLIPD